MSTGMTTDVTLWGDNYAVGQLISAPTLHGVWEIIAIKAVDEGYAGFNLVATTMRIKRVLSPSASSVRVVGEARTELEVPR